VGKCCSSLILGLYGSLQSFARSLISWLWEEFLGVSDLVQGWESYLGILARSLQGLCQGLLVGISLKAIDDSW